MSLLTIPWSFLSARILPFHLQQHDANEYASITKFTQHQNKSQNKGCRWGSLSNPMNDKFPANNNN